MSLKRTRGLAAGVAALLLVATGAAAGAENVTLLNASYDVTRELYRDVNAAFAASWKKRTGQEIVINQSHAGSSSQARAVIDGLAADVVTMNQQLDVDAIAEKGLLPRGWADRLPNHSVPFTSTIVFLVRKGNPKQIRDWNDVVRPGVVPIIPNPKTSGNGRYSYLAAWAYALRQSKGSEEAARDFVGRLFRAVPVLDTGGRGATTTFVQRRIGDVLLTFENEARLAVAEAPPGTLATVVPSVSILAEAPVAVVDRVASKRGTAQIADAYLRFLFSEEAQGIAARHSFRPVSTAALAKDGQRFPALTLVGVGELGGWRAIQDKHFVAGGLFNRIYQPVEH